LLGELPPNEGHEKEGTAQNGSELSSQTHHNHELNGEEMEAHKQQNFKFFSNCIGGHTISLL
jgi:hypothetical protein